MKENRRIIILYILLILIFILLFIYNLYRNSKLDVDRKIDLFFNNYSYDEVIKISDELFLNAIDVLNTNNLMVELNKNNRIRYYVFDDNKSYKKIIEMGKIINTFAKVDLDKYINDKKIIIKNNEYYIQDYDDIINKDYIGSILNIKEYNLKEVIFTSINYYSKDNKYQGLFDEIPKNYYKESKTEFKIIFEDNNLKITNIEELEKIIA